MGSLWSSAVLCVSVAAATLILPMPGVGNAEPGPSSSTQTNAQKRAAAKNLVDEGNAAKDAKDYDRAIDLYITAFSLVSHPLLLFNIAQSHRLAGRPERAVPFYERYLALDPDGTEAATARVYLAEAKRAQATIPMGQLSLSSTPEGLTVILDGEKIGVTPLVHDLAAGSHAIVLVDGETRVDERTVQIRAGATSEVTMLVVRSPVDRQTTSPSGSSRVLPVTLFAVGGTLLLGSSVGFYYGQKGWPEDNYYYRGATTTGFVLAGVGAAAIGVGIWQWRRGSRESAPLVTIGPGEAYLGWGGRY